MVDGLVRRDGDVVQAMSLEKHCQALAIRIAQLERWRRWLLAFGCGVTSILAMAPFFLFPVLFVTLPPLVWLIDGCLQRNGDLRSRVVSSAAVGWWFGFGYHLAGLFWIGEAFLVEADKFAWLLPIAVTLLPAGLALFHAAAATATGALLAVGRGSGLERVLVLAVTLSAAEWLRGHVLTGFPWNVLGYALTHPLSLMQSASLIGIYALSLLAVLIFAAPLVVLANSAGVAGWSRRKSVALAIPIVPLLAALTFGTLRLAVTEPPAVENVRLRLVQPSIPQHEKWRQDKQGEFFRAHLDRTVRGPDGTRDNLKGITHVIWAEASMPFLPLEHPDVLQAIGRTLPEGVLLLAGALRIERQQAGLLPVSAESRRRAFNSLLVLGEGGSLSALYDKIHLVPFGEYLPFQETLEAIGLEQLSRMRGGFSRGPRPRALLAIPGLPLVGPLICYEAIFPGAVVQGGERPGLLVNVTNDGWFGNTTGPHQHFHQTRVRAVEEGLPMVRVANNGISAVIDAKGRIRSHLPLNARGVIDSDLPAAGAPPVYARFGDAIFGALWLGLAIFLAWRLPRSRVQH